MSNISSFSSLQTTNFVCQNVHLTDDLKIGLEYDIHNGLLNIFVKNTEKNISFPSQINILSNPEQTPDEYLIHSSEFQQDSKKEITNLSYGDENEPKICIELSNIYVYDFDEENETDHCQTIITSPILLFSSSSSSSSCFDDQTTDNDDGYSTHSLDDDTDQQHSLSILPSKFLIPFVPYQHHYDSSSEELVSSIRRLIDRVIWLSPFKKSVKQMMLSHLFD